MTNSRNSTAAVLDRNQKMISSTKGKVYKNEMAKSTEKKIERVYDMRNVLGAPPNLQSVYSILIADKENPVDDNDKVAERNLMRRSKIFEGISKQIMQAKESNRHILALFPDLKRAITIIISTMLSASKLTDTQILYKNGDARLRLDKVVMGEVLKAIENRMNTIYKFQDKLEEILYEVCATDGSSPRLILSEAVVNDVVNSDLISKLTMESYKNVVNDALKGRFSPSGIIEGEFKYELPKEPRPVDKMLQKMFEASSSSLLDNTDVVGYNKIKKSIRDGIIKSSIKETGKITKLSNEKLRYLDIFRTKNTSEGERPFLTLHERDEATRRSIGKALELKLSPESVGPIFVPGDQNNHIGYIVMLDENFQPITGAVSRTGFNKINTELHSEMGTAGSLATTYRDLLGDDCDCIDSKELYALHGQILERQLKEMFIKSSYGEHVEVSNFDYIQYTMFFRSLQDLKTQLLYVPASNLCYFSMKNNDYGIGVSLLDAIKTVAGIRATVMFAEILGFVKSSIDTTDVDITLDEYDSDPDKTFDMIKGLILQAAGGSIPFGLEDPQEISSYLLTAGYRFNLASMPGMPNIDIQYRSNQSDHVQPQSDLKDKLQEHSLLGLDFPPEMISDLFSSEFAVGKLIQNAIFVRTIRGYQKEFSREMTKYVSTILYNDAELREEIKVILKKNERAVTESIRKMKEGMGITGKSQFVNPDMDEDAYLEAYIDDICKAIDVSLPLLNDSGLDANTELLDAFEQQVDKILDIMLNDRIYTEEIAGQAGMTLETFKAMLKQHWVREWAAENNFAPQIFEFLTANTEDNKDTLDAIQDVFGAALTNINKVMASLTKIKLASDKDMAKIINEAAKASEDLSMESSGGLDFSSVEFSKDDEDDDDDKDSGDDDFDLDGFDDDW